MDVESHFNFILENYNLKNLYRKFTILSLTTTSIKEGFYWALIYLSNIVKEKPELITQFSIFLISLLGINVPIERYFNNIKSKLIKEIKLANTKYFNERVIQLSKKDLLKFDLVEYYGVLEHFNENMEEHLINIKIKHDIPIRSLTLIIIALNKKFTALIGLFVIFYAIVKTLSENKIHKENELTKKYFQYESIIRNYIINGKNFLINDEFNKKYLSNNFNKYEKINRNISELNNKLDMNINFTMLCFIIIVIWSRIRDLNQYDFFYYFLIIYDVEFIADKVQEYYKSRVNYNKMTERLKYLASFKPDNLTKIDNTAKIDSIIINKIINDKPKLVTTEPIIIKQNDNILIDGKSGSGKTSLLYILKGVIKPTQLDINPNLELINSQTYLTLPNHKSLYSGNLYDIITNYDENPNIELINRALQSAKIFDKLNKNEFVDIDNLSGGEKIRVLIARIIYAVKTKNYNILLFDEIDENLNDDLAQEIYLNLKNIFNDKIILYVTHNEKVKQMFTKKYIVKDGIITNK